MRGSGEKKSVYILEKPLSEKIQVFLLHASAIRNVEVYTLCIILYAYLADLVLKRFLLF
jgi:hypothetical protein